MRTSRPRANQSAGHRHTARSHQTPVHSHKLPACWLPACTSFGRQKTHSIARPSTPSANKLEACCYVRVPSVSRALLVLAVVILCVTLSRTVAQDTEPAYRSNVGMPNTINDLILPGSELAVRPLNNDTDPLVVRIVKTIRHGDAHRYQIEYYGLEPGTHDLTDYLQRTDGTLADDLPVIPVRVDPLLPAGQIQPNPMRTQRTPSIGGYRVKMLLAGTVWLAGLLVILFAGRRKILGGDRFMQQEPSLADRLRPIVEDAMHNRLTESKQAELERLLLTYWRQRLDLNEVKAAEAITALRQHEEAGQLLRQLESWLHKPAGQRDTVDVGELLKPYRNVRDSAVA